MGHLPPQAQDVAKPMLQTPAALVIRVPAGRGHRQGPTV